jgi:archaellum biogenesis protein FlaJ (TadC family)
MTRADHYLVPIWWGIAWLLAAAVPQISHLGSFVGAACIMPFTYTFPPLLLLGYNAQNDAMLPGEDFNPQTGQVQRLDHGFKRLIRGFKRQFAWNSFYVIYALASIASAGLGIWASITAMHKHFAEGQCHWLHLCEPSWLDQHRAVALGSFS